jgi:hypothetical protein
VLGPQSTTFIARSGRSEHNAIRHEVGIVAFTAKMPAGDCDTIRREFWGEAEGERVYWKLSGGCGSEDEEGK